MLVDYRLSQKSETVPGGSLTIKREEDFLKGLYIAMPKKRDEKERLPSIPIPILHGEKLQLNRPTLKQEEDKSGGAGVFNFPLQGKTPYFILNHIFSRTFYPRGPGLEI